MYPSQNQLPDVPYLGAGLAYRRPLKQAILDHKEQIDFLEVITEQFIEDSSRLEELEELSEIFTVIPHGISLSACSATFQSKDYLCKLKQISNITNAPYYSEHLSITHVPGIDILQSMPLCFNETVLDMVARNINYLQDYLGKQVILETVSYQFALPGQSMEEPEFYSKLVATTGCGILLDVSTVANVASRRKFDAWEFITAMPLESVIQTHICGDNWIEGPTMERLSEGVQAESWRLLELLAQKTNFKGTIVELLDPGANYPPISNLVEQVNKARNTMIATKPV